MKIVNFKLNMVKKSGFTLMEILIAIAIMGIMAALLSGNFISSQKKARDAQRKADLRQMQNALELYFNDKSVYPVSSGGVIVGCGNCNGAPSSCTWNSQSEFRDTVPSSCGTTYMKKLPKDPVATQNYYYWSDGTSYKLYACLENTRDQKILNPLPAGVSCGGGCTTCNYGVASPNAAP